MPRIDSEHSAWFKGARANADGQSIETDNPYPNTDRKRWQAWRDGWIDNNDALDLDSEIDWRSLGM